MRLFDFGVESVNLTAVSQQLFLVAALYQKRRGDVEEYLGSDAQVVIWVENQATYPPSWTLIRQGEDEWFLVVEGTTNATQMVDHFGGTFWREDFAGDTLANGAWVAQVEVMKLEIARRLGAIPRGKWHTSGHSYGAGMAQLFAYDHIDEYAEDEVQIIGIAAPRAMSAFYTGKQPKSYWRVSSSWDLVPELPPPWASFVSTKWVKPIKWASAFWVWYHYGTEYTFAWNGDIVPGADFPPEVVPAGVAKTFPEVHFIPNYASRLKQWEIKNGPFPVMADALNRALEMYGQGEAKVVPWEMPQIIPGPDGEPVLIPDPDTVFSEDQKMPVYKCVYNFIGKGGSTWNETHYLQSSSSVDAASDEAIGASLLNSRLAMLSRAYTLNGLSITQVGGNRVSRKRYIGLNGTLAPDGVAADIAGVSLSLKWFGAQGGSKFSWLRGITDDVITVNPDTGVIDLKPSFLTLLGAYRARLTEYGFGWLPRVPVDPGAPITQYNPITLVNGTIYPGFAVITCLNPVLVAAGGYITITQVNQKQLPGLKGKFKVWQASGSTCVVEYQTPNSASVENPGGRMRVYQDSSLNAYSGVAFVRAVGRRTKNAFSASRASQSARGLRTAR